VRGRLALQLGVVAVIAALVGLLAWRLSSEEAGKSLLSKVARGEKPAAPELTLPRLGEDGTMTLASLRGKVVVLNAWASWCPPCKDEAPALQRAYERWKDRGVVVLGLDFQDTTADALAFVDRHGITYPNVRDGSGDVVSRWGVTGPPETFFIDRQGRIVSHVPGPLDLQTLDRAIEQAAAA
jgi:cytochrome c biogenesis protein CcmG/thiol:disulfide interchange protein DsbE